MIGKSDDITLYKMNNDEKKFDKFDSHTIENWNEEGDGYSIEIEYIERVK